MKTEDIDKRIGMPDVDKEWARFEQEVIDPHQQPPSMWRLSAAKNSPPRGRWRGVGGLLGIGIAASVALLLIFNIGKQQTEQTPHIAKTEEIKPQPTPLPVREGVQQVKEQEVVTKTPIPVIAQNKKLALANANVPAASSLDIPAREYTGAVQKIKMDDMGDLAFESVDQALQGQIAGQDISHNEAEPELQGVIAGHEGIDPTYNDSILVLLDGKRLPDSLCTRQFARRGIHKYLEKKGLLVDKIVRLNEESVRIKGDEQTKQRYKQYVEQYGRLAQLGVAEITSANDSANEVFVLQHPELKKTFRRVEGFVMEESTNEPLESTIIRHRQFATSADPLGHFVLWVPKSVDTLYAKCIGCQDAFFQPADTTLTIRLKDNYRSHDIASADLSSGTTMRLRGIGDNKIDSFLVVVNGKTLFDSRGMTSEETERRLEEYLNEQGLLQDIKIPWKNGAIEIYASTPEEREERQRMIANATIVPNPSYFGSNSMRLHGTGDYRPSDKDRMDSTLILINGEPLPEHLKQEVLGNNPDDLDTHMPRYFSRQGLLIDSVYVHKDSEFTEKFGGRAKYGVIELKTVPDTYCDAYVCKHPKLMKKYTRVEGYVVDNDGKPLTEAWVHIKKKSLTGAATDSTGHYAIWLPTRDVELCADQTGYRTVEFLPADSTRTIRLQKAKSIRLRGNSQEQIASLPKYVPEENEVRLLPQGVIGGSHDSTPNDSILYLINGVPQPKENNKWLDKRSYLNYFKGQHLHVSRVMDYMNVKQRYIEKYGEAAKHGVVEYICVEDTLCDYYMDQHEELKASRRRVSGVVYDENDEPLAHTMIYIWHEKRVWGFETTDSLGNFTFWVPRSDVKMEFTYVGFYKAVVVEPSDTFQTIYLLPNDNLKSLKESLKF